MMLAATEGAVRAEQSLREPERSVAELVVDAGKGDTAAWDALVERFAGLVTAVVRTYRLSPADAADVSQTTWLRLIENLHRISQPDRVGGWLATTARRESVRILRLADRQVPTSDEDLEHLTHAPVVSVDHDLLVDERDRALWEMFTKLPARCRLVLLALIGDPPMSYRDLSDALDMPVGSIGPTRARCLERLRALAADAGNLDTLRTKSVL
jgi:RNA polymerase sigma factor (sigma-70 family)